MDSSRARDGNDSRSTGHVANCRGILGELMKIYTKKGDDGTTSTFSGKRVSKDSPIMHAQGIIDELNATIGIALSVNKNKEIKEILNAIQFDLFVIGSEITLSEQGDKNKIKIAEVKINFLEETIDEIENKLPKLHHFVLPGGSRLSAQLHLSRTVCRRAERDLVTFIEKTNLETLSLKYINRLSDLLFVLARYANVLEKVKESLWKY
jgi:cob(I)alamin adenosyltransferase